MILRRHLLIRFCIAFGLVLLLAPLGGSCSHLRQLLGLVAEKPEIKLRQVDVGAFKMDRIQLVFVLDVANPNDFTLDFADLHYRVHGLGIELGEGKVAEPFSLAASRRTEVRLPFSVKPEVALLLFKKYLSQPGELKLHFEAKVFMDTAFGKMDMHFQDERTMVKGLKAY